MEQPTRTPGRGGFTLIELLVTIAVIAALAALGFSLASMMRERAQMARATEKLRSLGSALVSYTTSSGGKLPYEDAPGTDDWHKAAEPENDEVWYNALPRQMGAPGVGDLVESPEEFYRESYPIYIPGAPYPKDDKRFVRPYFAVAMNSRLQRKDEEGVKEQGRLASVLDPVRTVAFFEAGMPDDKQVSKAQSGFDAKPKANAGAFAARHNQKGVIVFMDGHTEVRTVSELIDRGGRIRYPQDDVVWTMDPDDDPN